MDRIPLEIRQAVYAVAEAEYGRPMQCTVAVEELSEAQKEICKILRGKPDLQHLAEEIADVLIMMEQMMLFFGLQWDVEKFRDQKIRRLVRDIGAELPWFDAWKEAV